MSRPSCLENGWRLEAGGWSKNRSPEPRAQSPEPRRDRERADALLAPASSPQPPAARSALGSALRIDEHAAIAALVFRRIQRAIGETDDGIVRRRRARVLRCRADTHTHPRRLGRCCVSDLQRVDLAYDSRCDLLRFFRTAIDEHRDDLLAAVTRDEIARTRSYRRAHCGRDATKALVARLVAVMIVVQLEMVDVDHDDRDRMMRRYRVLPRFAHAHIERLSIEQSREPVE